MMLLGAINSQSPPRGDFSIVEPNAFESDGIWVSIQEAWQVRVEQIRPIRHVHRKSS